MKNSGSSPEQSLPQEQPSENEEEKELTEEEKERIVQPILQLKLDPLDDYTEEEFEQFKNLKKGYFLKANDRLKLPPIEQVPQTTGLVPATKDLEKALKTAQNSFEEIKKKSMKMESLENKKRAKEVKILEEKLSTQHSELASLMKKENSKRPKEEQLNSHDLDMEIKKSFFPIAHRYESQLIEHHLQSQLHNFNLRFFECLAAQRALYEAEYSALLKSEANDFSDLNHKRSEELKRIKKKAGLTGGLFHTETDEEKQQEVEINHKYLKLTQEKEEEHQKRREEVKEKQLENIELFKKKHEKSVNEIFKKIKNVRNES
ncbi:eukaryotic translation initiation factor 3 subunit A-like [Zophobas morio]|uniref:eukaryotic translation initiation factor 3 subunit A-like n=1 Tax=Zophobas morio TaxID=2755281 RepID=UPI0030836C03